MADVFTPQKRSAVMAKIRSRGNRDTELKLITILHEAKITGWRRHARLPGRPDFILRRLRIAIFVDGCFWHGCPKHGRLPGSRREYWIPKLARNKARDGLAKRMLQRKGWRVIRFWEHELAKPERVVSRIRAAEGANRFSPRTNGLAKNATRRE
ncbi:MAG TPA: very short patch repair endonuclease [Verrucomicrobiae bacterium]|jgi:DNA mismatch endonuclease (patch repair protein)|nr:very short patch repair endonuclease [Verrucomicrobiae bacterium]